jgi:hypothetical protein
VYIVAGCTATGSPASAAAAVLLQEFLSFCVTSAIRRVPLGGRCNHKQCCVASCYNGCFEGLYLLICWFSSSSDCEACAASSCSRQNVDLSLDPGEDASFGADSAGHHIL